MKKKLVWVETDGIGGPIIRIFRSKKSAMGSNRLCIQAWYDLAVEDIRHQIFVRSRGECEVCSDLVTESSGEMHERKHRGKSGEISLENSIFVCGKTHRREHRKRNPQFSKKTLTSSKTSDKVGPA